MSESRERLYEELCARQTHFLIVFTLAVVFLILQVPYLFVTEQDSTLFVVATMNVVGSTAFALLGGGVLWLCRKRDA